MTTTVESLKILLGSRPYLVIATKGEALLAIHFSLRTTPETGTQVVLSFACSDRTVKFEHLKARGDSEYSLADPETQTTTPVKGARLSRIPIPLFAQEVPPYLIGKYAKEFKTFERLGEWVRNLILLEGFTPLFFSDVELFEKLFPTLKENVADVADALVLPDIESPLPNVGSTPYQSSSADGEDGDESEDYDEDDESEDEEV